MPLHDMLTVDRVARLASAGSRDAVIEAAARLLAGAAASSGEITLIRDSLRAREALASTAIGHGVALPHGRLANLEDTRCAFLQLTPPVEFGALDGQPVDLVVAMAVPEHFVQEHLHRLAEVAQRFSDPAFRQTLRAAGSPEALYRLLVADRPVAPECR
ncbi:PTS sugar transporter subunit IIA [Aerolutibacter ruishenii]|uniref:PTS system nitrogen regulatory IIA component n=1 Tax=Aerolutibacter ruishenii TaxID=686800 RepID=A0A562LPA7_9GAMM|nr:PTS sugar transporter subunit IIA [Lysobacter ruishenii]TWI09464.1 PTS system nitrogen regulatory IIA component [Lysobacter ruishenii]